MHPHYFTNRNLAVALLLWALPLMHGCAAPVQPPPIRTPITDFLLFNQVAVIVAWSAFVLGYCGLLNACYRFSRRIQSQQPTYRGIYLEESVFEPGTFRSRLLFWYSGVWALAILTWDGSDANTWQAMIAFSSVPLLPLVLLSWVWAIGFLVILPLFVLKYAVIAAAKRIRKAGTVGTYPGEDGRVAKT